MKKIPGKSVETERKEQEGQKRAPRLSSEATTFRRRVLSEFRLDDSGQLVLRQACESLDRVREAQRLLATDGLVIRDRWGQPKPHPAAGVEASARLQLLRCLKALGIDLEPLNDGPGRPPGR
jgi:P27 family predicted phage terminase small subunit